MGHANWILRDINNPTIDYQLLDKFQQELQTAPVSTRCKLRSIKYCCQLPIGGNCVHVLKSNLGAKAHAAFTNLAHCRSIWCCPVCTPYRLREIATKITALIRRREKLNESAFMYTFTFPHRITDSASQCVEQLKSMRKFVFGGGPWACLKQKNRISGIVQSVECTYSAHNGWHFHIHMLIFFENDTDLTERVEKTQQKLLKRWTESYGSELPQGTDSDYWLTKSVYLSRDNDQRPRKITAGDYICSYGATEMAKITNDSKKSVSPFELLTSNNPADQKLFVEYALATHGQRRIQISPKLNRSIRPEDYEQPSDVTLTKKKQTVVCSFSKESWYYIKRYENYRARGTPSLRVEILKIAIENNNPNEILQKIREALTKANLNYALAQPPIQQIPQRHAC